MIASCDEANVFNTSENPKAIRLSIRVLIMIAWDCVFSRKGFAVNLNCNSCQNHGICFNELQRKLVAILTCWVWTSQLSVNRIAEAGSEASFELPHSLYPSEINSKSSLFSELAYSTCYSKSVLSRRVAKKCTVITNHVSSICRVVITIADVSHYDVLKM
jgi:hypothetical protein